MPPSGGAWETLHGSSSAVPGGARCFCRTRRGSFYRERQLLLGVHTMERYSSTRRGGTPPLAATSTHLETLALREGSQTENAGNHVSSRFRATESGEPRRGKQHKQRNGNAPTQATARCNPQRGGTQTARGEGCRAGVGCTVSGGGRT